MNATKSSSLWSRRGFTLVEVVIVSVLLGIFAYLTAGYISDATNAGRDNVRNGNARALNDCVTQLRAAECVFLVGGATFKNLVAGGVRQLTFPATANAAAVSSFVTALRFGGGIRSYDQQITLADKIRNDGGGDYLASLTPASYTYTIVDGIPVFTGIPGTRP